MIFPYIHGEEEYPEKQSRIWKDNIKSDRKSLKLLTQNLVQWRDMGVVYLMILASSSDVASNGGIGGYTVI